MTTHEDGPPHADWARVGQLAELGLLSASLLHELRQPLLAIQATAELALAAGSADAARWQKVLTQLRHVRGLLDGYSGLSRQDGVAQRFDARRAARAALATLAPHARASRVTLTLEEPPTALPVVMRETALRQVLVNLIHNAVDATAAAGGRRVILRADAGERAVMLRVHDEGAGVSPGEVGRLFEPFVSGKPVGRGTGLGLFIARTLVDEVGGTLSLEPAPDGGSVATVRLDPA